MSCYCKTTDHGLYACPCDEFKLHDVSDDVAVHKQPVSFALTHMRCYGACRCRRHTDLDYMTLSCLLNVVPENRRDQTHACALCPPQVLRHGLRAWLQVEQHHALTTRLNSQQSEMCNTSLYALCLFAGRSKLTSCVNETAGWHLTSLRFRRS